MRLATLAFCLLTACASLPPEGTPYFESTASGDNLYPAVTTRIYATDQKVQTQDPHPYNDDRGLQTITDVPGAFAEGLEALATILADAVGTPLPTNPDGTLIGPDACCHVFVQRTHTFFDGQTTRGISEAVWRRAAGIPPFVDEPIGAN